MTVIRLLACLLALIAAAALAPAARAQAGAPDDPEWVADDPAWTEDDPAPDPWGGEPVPLDPAVPEPVEPVGPMEPIVPVVPVPTTRTIAGKLALVRADGKAAIPRGAPARVRALIAAANEIAGKRYKWGGGHAKLVDRGYDCSGAVGYGLIRTGLLGTPMVSGSFARWGVAGPGRWITIYANRGHVYMEVAGLRLDTSATRDPAGRSGVRWRPAVGRLKGFHVRHIAGL
jgi:hypothetical protein